MSRSSYNVYICNTRSTHVNQSNYSNKSNDKLEKFDEQIQKLESFITDLKTDKNMDSKIKNMKIEALQQQINDLKNQKQEYASQLIKEGTLKKESKQSDINQENSQDKYDYAKGLTYYTTKTLVSSDCDIKNISKTNSMRISLSDDIRTKNMEMSSQTRHSPTKFDSFESGKLSSGLSQINMSFGEQLYASTDKIKDNNKNLEEIKENEKSKEEEIYENKQESIDVITEEYIIISNDSVDKYKNSVLNSTENIKEENVKKENKIYTETANLENKPYRRIDTTI
ncbi:hypothetical protein [Clostridioides sp. ES-S-0190-01]|uniref:hypothetical protein n=1 Tax=Clostridioides sp. ES-S-0190-01 TaxID=2770787 RepID=UPI001D12944C|nr:FlxA-like family protein [Clostridioides sp. ES-S-0190-01]